MPRLALAVLLIYFVIAFGWRSFRQWRRTGSTGFRGISGAIGSAEWFGGVLFVVALLGALLTPLADLLGWQARIRMLEGPALAGGGMLLTIVGAGASIWAQVAMGDSWRIGVDQQERTVLITHGPFRLVRNPIFSSMGIALIGLVLLVPSTLALATLVTLVVALQLQVRWVEEPYLASAHGAAWQRYAARTGRFTPWSGRLRRGHH